MNLFGATGVVLVLVVVVVLLVVAVTTTVLIARARRLDRLHVRTDAAAAGLAAVLDRRAAVVRAVAATAGPVALGEEDRRSLRTAARAVTAAGGGGTLDAEREACENDLTHALAPLDTAALPADLAAELADAHARVSVARRVHNDAVRDTRALRGRRMVRWLHLAGTAPVPHYFEIAEPGPDAPASAPRAARDAVRVVVVDDDRRVLLFQGVDPARPAEAFWFTPGGGVGPDEDPRDAVVRTLDEETGLHVDHDAVSEPLWIREVIFEVGPLSYVGREVFHLVRVAGTEEIDTAGFTEHEARTVRGHRWWTAAELAVTLDVVHPHQLGDLLADPGALAPAEGPLVIH